MKILKSLAMFLVYGALIFAIFLVGVKTGASTIQQSCDNQNESRTVINGHVYFCHDYDAVSRAFAVLQQRGGA